MIQTTTDRAGRARARRRKSSGPYVYDERVHPGMLKLQGARLRGLLNEQVVDEAAVAPRALVAGSIAAAVAREAFAEAGCFVANATLGALSVLFRASSRLCNGARFGRACRARHCRQVAHLGLKLHHGCLAARSAGRPGRTVTQRRRHHTHCLHRLKGRVYRGLVRIVGDCGRRDPAERHGERAARSTARDGLLLPVRGCAVLRVVAGRAGAFRALVPNVLTNVTGRVRRVVEAAVVTHAPVHALEVPHALSTRRGTVRYARASRHFSRRRERTCT
mmetsp:Transcript_25483/g.71550  ORF Transcript_25483/g.71550 Transcript_25483/m.71550 type:complete len:276 (-) Transcript_25483:423-1250(-)